MKKLTFILALTSLPLYAQNKDFGDLAFPNDRFSITNEKSTFKNEADIHNYEVKKTPEKEEYVYKPTSIKTPQRGLKKANFKLTVEREAGKVSRISSVSYENDQEDESNSQMAKTTTLNPSGKVDSYTWCGKEFKIGKLGFKKKTTGISCNTVNPQVCDYISKNKINEELYKKVRECGDLLQKVSGFQKDLHNLSKKDHAENMSSIAKMNVNFSNTTNYQELEATSLRAVSSIAASYEDAINSCEFLRESKYLPEVSTEEPSHSVKPSKTNKAKGQ
jgi:hypothetical protein